MREASCREEMKAVAFAMNTAAPGQFQNLFADLGQEIVSHPRLLILIEPEAIQQITFRAFLNSDDHE